MSSITNYGVRITNCGYGYMSSMTNDKLSLRIYLIIETRSIATTFDNGLS